MGYRDKDRSMQFLRGTNATFGYYEEYFEKFTNSDFDEATANIDEKRRGRFYQLLHELSREKIIIFSTHNLEELREADIIVDLEKMHIRQVSEK